MVKPTLKLSRAPKTFSEVNHSKIKNQHCEPHIHLNHAYGSYSLTNLNHMTTPKEISNTHAKANLDDVTAKYSKAFAQFLTVLEQEEKKNIARERLLESKKEDLESWKLALKYKSKVSQLRLDDLLKENHEGWAYLLNWIEEVESNSAGDSVRLYMLKLTA